MTILDSAVRPALFFMIPFDNGSQTGNNRAVAGRNRPAQGQKAGYYGPEHLRGVWVALCSDLSQSRGIGLVPSEQYSPAYCHTYLAKRHKYLAEHILLSN
jgi:hypothetical protein